MAQKCSIYKSDDVALSIQNVDLGILFICIWHCLGTDWLLHHLIPILGFSFMFLVELEKREISHYLLNLYIWLLLFQVMGVLVLQSTLSKTFSVT